MDSFGRGNHPLDCSRCQVLKCSPPLPTSGITPLSSCQREEHLSKLDFSGLRGPEEVRSGGDFARSSVPVDRMRYRNASRFAASGAADPQSLQAGGCDLLTQGFYSAHYTLPRLLRLLHLPARSRTAWRAHYDSG